MRTSLLAAAIAAVAFTSPARAQVGTLRVVRVTPTGDAGPMPQISVAFDRPVAGSLDRSVDPATIFRIEPAVRGRLEWRDPVTIRLTPAAPLAAGSSYIVSIGNTFKAMDGSALAEPYRFVFRVHGPMLLTGSPVYSRGVIDHVTPTQRFSLVYSSPVDLPTLSGTAYIELSTVCGAARIVRLDATSQRPVQSDDNAEVREAGGWQRDHSADSLRRVVQLVPRSPLPHGCPADLVIPTELSPEGSRGTARWSFSTYGDLKIAGVRCGYENATSCPSGPINLTFTNPVRGSDVARRVRLFPETPITIRDTSSTSTSWTLEAKLKPRIGYAIIVDTAIKDVFGQSLRGNPAIGVKTTGFQPTIIHPVGHLVVERVGFRTLAVQHVNVDTLIATLAPVPDSLTAKMLSRYAWRGDTLWQTLLQGATVRRFPVRNAGQDHAIITGIPLPAVDVTKSKMSTLFAVRIDGRGKEGIAETSGGSATTVVQVTDLGVHAKIGTTEGAVWVTGVSDGAARPGATVTLHDALGREIASAQTNAQGLARFTSFRQPPKDDDDVDPYGGF